MTPAEIVRRCEEALARLPGGVTPDERLPMLLADVVTAPSRAERIEPLLALAHWLFAEAGAGASPVRTADLTIGWTADSAAFVRLQRFLLVLEHDAGLRDAVADVVAQLGAGDEAAHLFAVAGMPSSRGFFAELVDRMSAKCLPVPRERDALAFLRQLAEDEATVGGIQRLTPALMQRLVAALGAAGDWAPLRRAAADGFRLLNIRVQAHGLGPDLAPRPPPGGLTASPFFRVTAAALALADAWTAGGDVAGPAARWHAEAAACRARMAEVHAELQQGGISVATVFALDVVERSLVRMAVMADLMSATDAAARAEAMRRLLIRLATYTHQDRSVRHLATTNLRLLHRRIVERSAATGSHYIAHSRAAYRAIWLRAAGGGLVTVMTAAVKTAIGVLHHAVHLAPLPLGLLYGINYAASFICLQHAGLILATKQPAMTAAALSTEVAASRDGGIDHARIVAVTMRIVQSQFAAAVANVAMVSLGAVAFDALWHLGTGRHWLRPEDALSIYNDLSPIDSLTVFYAALTGVILWLSSLIGGWADNWSARNRIHLGIAELRLGGRIGRPRMARWGEAWRIHIAGWATNISLGMMLGMTPALGYVLGLPLDVRHVTLNSGILSLACVGLEGGWWRDGFFLLALWGVAVMFVLNLGVSFGLSLYTALRAYELGPGELRRILGAIVRHALRHPLDLVLPRGLPAHAPH